MVPPSFQYDAGLAARRPLHRLTKIISEAKDPIPS
jgi:hypothetical protein